MLGLRAIFLMERLILEKRKPKQFKKHQEKAYILQRFIFIALVYMPFPKNSKGLMSSRSILPYRFNRKQSPFVPQQDSKISAFCLTFIYQFPKMRQSSSYEWVLLTREAKANICLVILQRKDLGFSLGMQLGYGLNYRCVKAPKTSPFYNSVKKRMFFLLSMKLWKFKWAILGNQKILLHSAISKPISQKVFMNISRILEISLFSCLKSSSFLKEISQQTAVSMNSWKGSISLSAKLIIIEFSCSCSYQILQFKGEQVRSCSIYLIGRRGEEFYRAFYIDFGQPLVMS